MPCWPRRARPSRAARSASAWAPPGARPRTAISTPSAPWWRASRRSGLETCVTLGMLTAHQAQRLKGAGLDYYNHNLDTSPEYYGAIITTRTYQDRLDTLAHVREAGIHVCCGGIVGMGEGLADRVGMIATLASLPHASRKRADQHAGAGGGHAARAGNRARSARLRAHHCGGAHHHAGLRWCGSRPAART